MRRSTIIAGTLAVAASVWIASGQFGGDERMASADDAASDASQPDMPTVPVRVRAVFAKPRERIVTINGRTEESRKVTLRAETAGAISEVPGKQGDPVVTNQTVARQTPEDRRALLREAEALVEQRQIEYNAARELSRKGFRSDTQLAGALSQLDAARARVESTRIGLSRTEIRAPFDGVLESRAVELGDYVSVGDNVAVVVDLDPLHAVGYVSERDVASVEPGTRGSVRLVDGTVLEGSVRYIATVADPETRTFRVELEVPNPGNAVRAGLTGELRLPLSPVLAYVISPAVLTLADDGRIGVRVVTDDDLVEFVPVSILSNSDEGIWVTGLKDGQRLITVGHEFVRSGQKVRAVYETADTGS